VKTIGIVGGGQLGKMLILEAKRLGFEVAVLDPAKDCPCHSIADIHIVKGFKDESGFSELAKVSQVITYEFEHISAELLSMLEDKGHKIFPSVASLRTIQDKLWQKTALLGKNIAVPNFLAVENAKDIENYFNKKGTPLFLKSRRGGYDGKGNFFIKSASDIALGYEKLNGNENELMIEDAVNYEREVSVIATRAENGECEVYPIADNIHKDSILDTTFIPANISKSTEKKVMEIAKSVLECFNGVGTFCVELFIEKGTKRVLVNEVAPRVHNTGHYTIEACRTNQFENHIRAITGLGLGSAEMVVGASIMKNVIGGKGENGKAVFEGIEDAYKIKNVNAHIYGKTEVKEGRKMGHFTITAKTLSECVKILDKINIKAVKAK